MARPKIENEDERKHSLTITLTKADIRKLKKIGNGNASQAVRYILLGLEKNCLQKE